MDFHMRSQQTTELFLINLEQSRLVNAEQLADARAEAAAQIDVTTMAANLVARGVLTQWQSEQIVAGQTSALWLGDYMVLEPIGAGGMGAVYKARAVGVERVVAVKCMTSALANDEKSIARFKREIRTASAMDHPNIVKCYDTGVANGTLYLVMEFVDGHDLASWVRRYGPLPIDFACECARQVALGLQHAFERGLVHRDLKPANIIVTWIKGSGRPLTKILDLGLARFVSENTGHTELTFTGQFIGTAEYIAPEQAQSARKADIRSDLFALGCTLVRLLTAQLPYDGETPMEMVMARMMQEAKPLRQLLPDAPEALEVVVSKFLARDPSKRFQTPLEAAEALLPFTGQFVANEKSAIPPPAGFFGTLATPTGADGPHTPTKTPIPLRPELASASALADFPRADLTPINERSPAGLGQPHYAERSRGNEFEELRHLRETPADRSWSETPTMLRASTQRPTLIVGIGKTGIRALVKTLRKISTRFRDETTFPLRYLAIDADGQVLDEIERVERLPPELYECMLFCKLRKANQYLNQWERLGHLSSWLPSDTIYQINPAGTTGACRQLGRLALVDNYRRVIVRMQSEAQQLLGSATQGALSSLLPPRVYVMGAMGGGSSSGMFVEICYWLRRAFADAGASKVDLRGLLALGTPPGDRDRELHLVNQYALLTDIERYMNPEAEFSARYETGGNTEVFRGHMADGLYFFDLSATHLPEPKVELVLDQAAEFLRSMVADPLGGEVERVERSQRWPRYRSVGMFSLFYPAQHLLRRAACRVNYLLAKTWLEPISEAMGRSACEQVRRWLHSLFDLSTVGNELIEELTNELNGSIDSIVVNRLQQLDADLQANNSKPIELCQAVLQEFRQLFGDDPGEEKPGMSLEPKLQPALRAATNRLANTMVEPILATLKEWTGRDAPRLELYRHKWDACLDYFGSAVKELQQSVQGASKAIAPAAQEVREGLAMVAKADQRRMAGLRGPFLETLQAYALTKFRFLFAHQIMQFFMVLRGKISDKSRDLVSMRHQVERLIEILNQGAEAMDDTDAGLLGITVAPEGVESLGTAAEISLDQSMAQLQDRINLVVLGPRGGLGLACQNDRSMLEFANALIQEGVSLLRETLPNTDVAGCFLAQQQDDAALETQFQSFFDWAKPSVAQSPSTSYSVPRLAPVEETLFLSVPDSASGRQFVHQVTNVLPQLLTGVAHEPDRCVFCRLLISTSPRELVPAWLLEARTVFERAARSRRTPIIYPRPQ